jgi:hypothetical protein
LRLPVQNLAVESHLKGLSFDAHTGDEDAKFLEQKRSTAKLLSNLGV